MSWLFLVLYFNLIPTFCFYFRTIPTNNAQCRNFDCNTDFEYGMNEDLQSYKTCARRLRNKGLFTADQVIVLPFCFCFFMFAIFWECGKNCDEIQQSSLVGDKTAKDKCVFQEK